MAVNYDKVAERQRIGARIKEIRESQGRSQEDVAEEAGITRPNLTNIENGKYSAGFDVLQKIALALGCKVDMIKE